MISTVPGAVYVLVALWLMNGDPMNPIGSTIIPGEKAFATKRACMAAAAERYAGAIDPRRGRIECVEVMK